MRFSAEFHPHAGKGPESCQSLILNYSVLSRCGSYFWTCRYTLSPFRIPTVADRLGTNDRVPRHSLASLPISTPHSPQFTRSIIEMEPATVDGSIPACINTSKANQAGGTPNLTAGSQQVSEWVSRAWEKRGYVC